jgi:subtilisin family serine protease
VAGTAAGLTYGAAKDASVVAVRVLGCSGSGSTSGIVAALDWIESNVTGPAVVRTTCRPIPIPLTVVPDAIASHPACTEFMTFSPTPLTLVSLLSLQVTMSLGGGFSASLNAAVDALVDAGVVVVRSRCPLRLRGTQTYYESGPR